jgi:predicted transcriptional regulator
VLEKLPPRERQLFEALCTRGEATAAELEAAIPDPPSNSAIRAMLSRMEKKGFVTHRVVDQKYVYSSAVPERNLKQSALRKIIQTFFNGSPVGAATALLGMSEGIEAHELDELEALIARARKEQGK